MRKFPNQSANTGTNADNSQLTVVDGEHDGYADPGCELVERLVVNGEVVVGVGL